jgi:cell filamentation protein, protein adenylyltransferase
MEPSQFQAQSPGSLVAVTDAQGARGHAFVPAPLPPPNLDLSGPDLRLALSDADQQIARLDALAGQLEKPETLFHSYLRREAQLSSAIEGTHTTLAGLAIAEASQRVETPDEREVLNYVEAFRYGRDRIGEIPVGRTLFNEVHGVLMRHADARLLPGQFRDCLVVLGRDLATARFVPPPHYEVAGLVDNLQHYLEHEREAALIKLAIAHYQFETIHPYRDGNGRIGRMMISLWLQQQRILTAPVLYISAYFERQRQAYYDALFSVSSSGTWEAWILFFLRAVAQQARDAIWRMRRLIRLRQEYYQRVAGPRVPHGIAQLIDDLFTIPALSVPAAARVLHVSYNAARESVRKLENTGIINRSEQFAGKKYWVASEIIRTLEEPFTGAE